jgi:putative transposase
MRSNGPRALSLGQRPGYRRHHPVRPERPRSVRKRVSPRGTCAIYSSVMPQSLSRVLTHLIFSTKHREPLLALPLRTELHHYLGGILRELECPPLQVGGVEDHVHLFFGLSRTKSIASVVETVKTSSSKWLKTQSSALNGFHWQTGYGVFSSGQSDADRVVKYIQEQEEHHRTMSFQDEYRRFLEKYQVSYDERYVWD